MKRRVGVIAYLATIMVTLSFVLASACAPSSSGQETASSTQEPDYVWRMANPWTDATRNGYAEVFCLLVNQYSEGQIQVDLFPDGVLGPHDETFHAVQEGSVEFGMFAPYVHLIPGGMLNWMPWTVGNYAEAALAFDPDDGMLFSVMDDAWHEVGCKMLWTTTLGAYGLGNNVRPIRTPQDMTNLKFRVSGSIGLVKALQNAAEGTGFTVETIPWTDTYGALERGVVDGCWNLWGLLVENRFTEVTKYYTALDFCWDTNNVVINLDAWESLTPELQDAVMRAGRVAETGVFESIRRQEVEYKQIVEDAGVEVYYPTAEERAVFREQARMSEIWAELCTPWLDEQYPNQDMTEEILQEFDHIRDTAQSASK